MPVSCRDKLLAKSFCRQPHYFNNFYAAAGYGPECNGFTDIAVVGSLGIVVGLELGLLTPVSG